MNTKKNHEKLAIRWGVSHFDQPYHKNTAFYDSPQIDMVVCIVVEYFTPQSLSITRESSNESDGRC